MKAGKSQFIQNKSQVYSILMAANQRSPQRWYWGMRFVGNFIFEKPFLWARNLDEFGDLIRCISWLRGDELVVPDIADIQFTTKLSQDILEGKISFVAALSIFNDKFEDDVIVDWWGYFDDLLTSKEPGAAWIREIYWNEYYDDIMEDSSDIPDDHIDHFIKWLNQYTD